ncbi:MAG TPA: YsnF/AvaK domain-containing protein [Microvirga sp.]|jgi:stress response protein YsnF|nr:YsnF/AvaK domain-containing protein [Microvirga sp.]
MRNPFSPLPATGPERDTGTVDAPGARDPADNAGVPVVEDALHVRGAGAEEIINASRVHGAGSEEIIDASRVQGAGAEEIIPIAEEVVRLDKRETVTGRVRVHTRVELETETVRAALATESVEVIRVPVDRPIDRMPEIRTENGVTIVPVVEEVLVVEKRLVLKEELHIRRNTQTDNVEIPVELRKHRVEVERVPSDEDREAGQS